MKWFNDNETMPHKKPGKNQSKSSPTKHGCPKNNYNAHNFVRFDTYYFNTYENKFKQGMACVMCFDCQKLISRKQHFDFLKKNKDSYGDLVKFKDGNYYEVEFNHPMTRIVRKKKLN